VLEIVYVRVLVVVPKFISKSERLSDMARRGRPPQFSVVDRASDVTICVRVEGGIRIRKNEHETTAPTVIFSSPTAMLCAPE
jgi:hypothetical protein